MNREELIAELKARGYTKVITYGGPVPIDEWDPYGLTTINYDPNCSFVYQGEIVGDKVHDLPINPVLDKDLCLGVWTVQR